MVTNATPLLLCALLGTAAAVQAADTLTLYVATDGSDAWSGRLTEPAAAGDDGPLATIAGARDAIRALRAAGDLEGPVTVHLRGGTYYLPEAVRFGPEDSGTAAAPITYEAYPGEVPELVGGRRIEGLTAGADGVLTVTLPEVRAGEWYFRQLFIDGKRQTRARYPNADPDDPYRGGFAYVGKSIGGFGAAVGNIHNPGDWMDWEITVPADGEYVVWMYYGALNEPFGRTDMGGRTVLSVDGGEPIPLLNLPDTGGWGVFRWARNATVSLTRGAHRLRWQNVQGGGLNQDGLALSDDPDWTPTGDVLPEPAPGRHVIVIQSEDFVAYQGKQLTVSGGGGSRFAFHYEPGDIRPEWADAPGAEVHVFQSGSCRAFKEIVAIESIDEATRTVHITGPECYAGIGTGDRYFVENLRDQLDAPGEWYLDRETGVLALIPPEGFTAHSEVIAPTTGRVLEFAGTPEAAVQHIRIRGLRIHCSDYSPDDGCGGYGMGTEGTLHFENAVGCLVERCDFRNTGTYAVCFTGGEGNRVTGCDIADSAEGGVLVIGSARNEITDNWIHDCGAIYKHIGGVVLTGAGSDDNLVAHNLIHHMSRYGITLKNAGLRNVIESNHVHHTNLETYDTGGIEVTQHDPELRSGSIIRNNIVADTEGWYAQGPNSSVYLSWGIYLDSYAGGYTVTDNITARNSHGGIMLQGGKDNVVTNNIFVDSTLRQMQISNFRNNSTGQVLERNIVYWTDPQAVAFATGALEPATIRVDYNLYFCPGIEAPLVGARGATTFAQWQEQGYDTHSRFADPRFVAPERDDYSLQPDSPAFALGFRAIDTSTVGLLTPR